MSRAWLCRNGCFWRFWGCRQEEGNCIWRAWLWGRCTQPNAARLHPVSLVGPETQTKRTLGGGGGGWQRVENLVGVEKHTRHQSGLKHPSPVTHPTTRFRCRNPPTPATHADNGYPMGNPHPPAPFANAQSCGPAALVGFDLAAGCGWEGGGSLGGGGRRERERGGREPTSGGHSTSYRRELCIGRSRHRLWRRRSRHGARVR
jgi:hypothetical protein